MILFRHSLKPPWDWCCTVFIFHDVLKRTLMFSPLIPGAHILLKNFMRSNYCFTAVPHRAFSIYIIISQASLLRCNEIRKYTLYSTDRSRSQGFVFALWSNDEKRGEEKGILSPRKQTTSLGATLVHAQNPNKKLACSVIRVAESRNEGAKVISLLVFPGYIS